MREGKNKLWTDSEPHQIRSKQNIPRCLWAKTPHSGALGKVADGSRRHSRLGIIGNPRYFRRKPGMRDGSRFEINSTTWTLLGTLCPSYALDPNFNPDSQRNACRGG